MAMRETIGLSEKNPNSIFKEGLEQLKENPPSLTTVYTDGQCSIVIVHDPPS